MRRGPAISVKDKQVSQVLEIVRSAGENDCRSKLNSAGLVLSVDSVTKALRALNGNKLSGLHFFNWVRDTNPNICRNADVCSLVIANCVTLFDHGSTNSLLKEFKAEQLCLTKSAFEFIPVLDSARAGTEKSIKAVVQILNKVGGSVRSSGIWALIEMLCLNKSFDMAKFVIGITEGKAAYYGILVRAMCRERHFEEARGLIDEMQLLGVQKDHRVYNYVIGGLCKSNKLSEAHHMLDEMTASGCPPDALTYDIIIYHSCRLGELDNAIQLLTRLDSLGLEPRNSTHAAIVQCYFNTGLFEDAHEYVQAVSVNHPHASTLIYIFLAELCSEKRDFVLAQRILLEMMDNGLRPAIRVFKKTVSQLRRAGRKSLAEDLLKRYSKFRIELGTTGG